MNTSCIHISADLLNITPCDKCDKPDSAVQARTVLQSNGKTRRFVLSQPPHFRTGQTAPLAMPESLESETVRAIRASQMAAVANGRKSASRAGRL